MGAHGRVRYTDPLPKAEVATKTEELRAREASR